MTESDDGFRTMSTRQYAGTAAGAAGVPRPPAAAPPRPAGAAPPRPPPRPAGAAVPGGGGVAGVPQAAGAAKGPAGTNWIDTMVVSGSDNFNWSQGVCAAANVATTGRAYRA